jgi:glucose-6-phosphate 1-dehydrogenase
MTPGNEFCFRLSPDVFISLTAETKAPGEQMVGETVRLVEHGHQGDAMEPYERLIGDALRGDRTLFGSEDGVEAAWRVVDPILNSAAPVCEYERGAWGPPEAERIAADAGGWIVPGVANSDGSAS